MQLGSTLFYKAQFDVETVDGGEAPFSIVLDDICRWLAGKHYRLFENEGIRTESDKANASISTMTVITSSSRASCANPKVFSNGPASLPNEVP